MHTYLALLRGINVGGKGLIKMAELKQVLESGGLKNVRTYIQSGNVIFSSQLTDTDELVKLIQSRVQATFNLSVGVAVFTEHEWRDVIDTAPVWWGADTERKHNVLVMIKPYDMDETVTAIGELSPDVEIVEPGQGVLYQSLSKALVGHTSTSKLIVSPSYKSMTIRNYNTATKLLALLS